MPIRTIRRYAQLVSAGPGNEQERLALMEAHRAEVTAKIAQLQENPELIDHKIDVYRGRWPPATPTNSGRPTTRPVPADTDDCAGGDPVRVRRRP
jgi:hypothetical protein